MEQTFDSFVCQRRQVIGISLRSLAARAELSPVYMSRIEADRKAAPAQEILERLATELRLDKEERETFLDLAAKSRKQRVSADLPDYIMEKDIVRTAKEMDATDEEWQEFVDRITKRCRAATGESERDKSTTGSRRRRGSRAES